VDAFGQLGKAAWGDAGGEGEAEEKKRNTHRTFFMRR
jgi:hypothetical protein